jgi:hypothetical protein
MPNPLINALNPQFISFLKEENKQREAKGNNPLNVIQAKYKDITDKNNNLNFVQRAENPNANPSIQNDGYTETHRMGYTDTDNGGAIAFPTIVQKQNGSLHKFENGRDAVKYAIKNKEFIPFNSVEDADAYTQNGLINHSEGQIPYADSNSLYGLNGVATELSKKEQSPQFSKKLSDFLQKTK